MQKTKSLYNIVIENCTFNTRLFYYTKTDHIGIGSTFQYQKEYNENNRDPNSVIKGSDEYKIMVSCIKQNINIKDFNGFIRNQLYCSKFNNSCKESNRKKYNRLCFICNKSEIENNQKLSVHHIDMNK